MDARLTRHPLGFWELATKPTQEELQQYYGDRYFQEAKGGYEHQYSPDELDYFRAKREQTLAVIQGLGHCDTGSVLDVGCGEGYTLAFFRERGWTVKGYDFSAAGVTAKNADCLDALVTGDVYELLKHDISADQTYDVVWLQNVLEHVIEPLDLLRDLRTLVSDGGVAVVTVPNDYSITQQAALRHEHIDEEFWVALPDHLSYFDSNSLQNASEATGWECAEILGDFPIDWFLFHPGANYVRDKSRGKAAHLARIQLENLIHEQPIDAVTQFWSALARLGFGRNLTAFLRPGHPPEST